MPTFTEVHPLDWPIVQATLPIGSVVELVDDKGLFWGRFLIAVTFDGSRVFIDADWRGRGIG